MKSMAMTQNVVSNEQFEMIQKLNDRGLKYLAFGNVAINTYEQGRVSNTIKLWVESSDENAEILKDIFGKPLQLKEPYKPLIILNAKNTREQYGIDFYTHITGFDKEDFDAVFKRKENFPVVEIKSGDRTPLPQLSLADLFQHIKNSNSKNRAYDLETLAAIATQKKLSVFPEKVHTAHSNRAITDFQQIKDKLDIEIVLQHYQYTLSSKSRPNSQFRIYKPIAEDDSQRIAVMADASLPYKGFVDINNPSFKGDVINFIHSMEKNDWRRTFQVIDSLIQAPDLAKNTAFIPDLVKTQGKNYLDSEKIRQEMLWEQYQYKPLNIEHIGFLKKRGLSEDVLFSGPFMGKILTVVEEGTNRTFINTAFPLQSASGRILSMDIRNEGYKAFPEGNKGQTLWMSNKQVIANREATLTNQTGETLQINSGQIGHFHNNRVVIGNNECKLDAVAHKGLFSFTPINRIVLTESPIDAISLHQLLPPTTQEHRLYVASCGQLSKEQQQLLNHVFEKNAQAQVVLAVDGDNPGIRMAINQIHHVIPDAPLHINIAYQQENEDGKNVAFNRLSLQLKQTIETEKDVVPQHQRHQKMVERFLEKANILQVPDNKAKVEKTTMTVEKKSATRVASQFDIYVPNDNKLLAKLYEGLVEMSNQKIGREKVIALCPTQVQKDFNQILQEREGKPLSERNPLYLKPIEGHTASLKNDHKSEKEPYKPKQKL